MALNIRDALHEIYPQLVRSSVLLETDEEAEEAITMLCQKLREIYLGSLQHSAGPIRHSGVGNRIWREGRQIQMRIATILKRSITTKKWINPMILTDIKDLGQARDRGYYLFLAGYKKNRPYIEVRFIDYTRNGADVPHFDSRNDFRLYLSELDECMEKSAGG